MNKLLSKQIIKFLRPLPQEQAELLTPLLREVGATYDSYDNDQVLMQRSLDISSAEMLEKNRMLEVQAAATEGAINILLKSVAELAPATYLSSIKHENSIQEIERLSAFLNNLIVEHKRSLEEMARQRVKTEQLMFELEKFKLAVDNATDYIVLCDEKFNVTYMNRSGLRRTDLSTLIGKGIWELPMTEASQAVVHGMMERVASGENNITYEVEVLGQGVDVSVIYLITTSIIRFNNEPVFAINILRDVTQDRHLERQKGDFVSVVSHELRTPMTVIRGYTNVLKEGRYGQLNPDQLEVIDKIHASAKSVIELVGEMLDLSKLSAGKLDINVQEEQLGLLVASELDKFKAIYDEKGIRLDSSVEYTDKVATDKVQFSRVLANLLGNAIKFTPTGGTVTVKTTLVDGGKQARVSVVDTGIGIPQDAMDQLFKKFSQVNNVLQRHASGTGLGLAICKDLVEGMGGVISVESEYTKGSTFGFTLPIDIIEKKETTDER